MRLAWVVLLVSGACRTSPPTHEVTALNGVVRASTTTRANEVARLLDDLAPRVCSLVPDSRAGRVEVWVQDEPSLYDFARSAYSDADGFWAEGARRIHLRDSADSLERTLAHELVHASLGATWKLLPGSLEEGLCDAIAGDLCPSARARMRFGRLTSAAFATGGLLLDLELRLSNSDPGALVSLCYAARLCVEGAPPVTLDPLRVFHVNAGISGSAATAEQKKALYGLAFLVVERAIARVGLPGLQELCRNAAEAGRASIPIDDVLRAADLGTDRAVWRLCLARALGPEELEGLVATCPDFLVQALAQYLAPLGDRTRQREILGRIEARLTVCGSPAATTRIASLLGLWPRIEQQLGQSSGPPPSCSGPP